MFEKPEDLEKIDNYFFKSPAETAPVNVTEEEYDDYASDDGSEGGGWSFKRLGTPLFKKTRIKLTNYYREREYKRQQELQKKEEALRKKLEMEEAGEEPVVEEKPKEEIKSDENSLELKGEVKEHVSSKEVQLDADNIDFDNETMEMIATGSPVLYFPPQKTTVKADKMIYNHASNKLRAFGHVDVNRNGQHVKGDYLQINMNEENGLMDNISTKAEFLTVTARTSEMDGDKIILYDGKMVSENSYILNLRTRMIGGNNYDKMIIAEKDRSSINDIGVTAVHIDAKDVIVNAKKDHDTITFKDAKINYNDASLFTIPSFTVHTNKKHEFFEANYPEFGSRTKLGMYAGPGFVFDTPLQGGSTLKAIPIINSHKNKIGFGGMLKYQSPTNYTDVGYGTANNAFFLQGRQMFDDNLYLQYGSNSYMDEWFLGHRLAKYNAELIYRNQTIIPSTIGKGLDLRYRQRAGIGYMHNADYNTMREHISANNMGTMRARYMGEVSQTLYKYEDREKLRKFNLALVMQGSAAVYGTGDTQFVGRVGPRVHTQLKYWMQDITFYASAYQDGTPMRRYDAYRYGHGCLYIREALRLNKYITVGWSGNINLTNDSPNGKLFQENMFILAIGPDDFKINLGYDWERRQTYVSFLIAMDTKGSTLNYERMIIKNPDKLSAKDEDEVELKVFDDGQKVAEKPKKMMYAEVVNIEDPNREEL